MSLTKTTTPNVTNDTTGNATIASDTGTPATDAYNHLLAESGDKLLTEASDHLILES